jgi:hypothetical protein
MEVSGSNDAPWKLATLISRTRTPMSNDRELPPFVGSLLSQWDAHYAGDGVAQPSSSIPESGKVRVCHASFCPVFRHRWIRPGIMMGAGPHDAATYFCGWSPFPDYCFGLVPSWFDKWGWTVPTSLLCVAIVLFLWAPISIGIRTWLKRYGLVSLHEAASHIYGELRGTELGRFTEVIRHARRIGQHRDADSSKR